MVEASNRDVSRAHKAPGGVFEQPAAIRPRPLTARSNQQPSATRTFQESTGRTLTALHVLRARRACNYLGGLKPQALQVPVNGRISKGRFTYAAIPGVIAKLVNGATKSILRRWSYT